MTGLSVESLRGDEPLQITPRAAVRFKKRADATDDEVSPAAAIAEQVAQALVKAVDIPASFMGQVPAGEARRQILAKWDVPDLEALIDFAWDHGIIVAHLAELPNTSKKFDGLTIFTDNRPVIVLASGRDSPAWFAFHVAHELGHVLCGHVTPDSPMSDMGIESDMESASAPDDPQENEADRYALELLTGDPNISAQPVYGLTGVKLAKIAQKEGPDRNIDPGVFALIYGRSANRLPAAQNALNYLEETSGAHDVISAGVRRHLKEYLPETVRMLVNLATES